VPARLKAVPMTTLRVVIADDHPLIREAFQLSLQRVGDVEVVATVADGQQAIDACERHTPHMVLLDYNMAGLKGSAAAAEIKRRFPPITVVGMSIAYSAKKQMGDAGADYFFDKTEIMKELPSVLEELRQNAYADRK
jgi:DNA-binding NarL/FixJ family response regulator